MVSEFIANKLKVEELDLTLDAGQIYEDWQERRALEDDIL